MRRGGADGPAATRGELQHALGIHAEFEANGLLLHAMLASPDGADLIRLSTHAPAGDPEAAGHLLADRLIDAGGDRVLASLIT